jgi:hypothetical protein
VAAIRLTTALSSVLAASLAGALLVASPVAAQSPTLEATWKSLQDSEGRRVPDDRVTGPVVVRGTVSAEGGVGRWRVDIVPPPEAAYPGFGPICEGTPDGENHVEVECPWDTTAYPGGGTSLNQVYRLRLSAWPAGGSSSEPVWAPRREVTLANRAAAPKAVRLAYEASTRQVSLSWKASPEPDVAKYVVEERVEEAPWQAVGEVGEPAFQRRLEQPGMYRYRVAAVRRAGDTGLAEAGPAAMPDSGPRRAVVDASDSRHEETPNAEAAPSSPPPPEPAPGPHDGAGEERTSFDLPAATQAATESPLSAAGRPSSPVMRPLEPAPLSRLEFELATRSVPPRGSAPNPATTEPDPGYSMNLPYPPGAGDVPELGSVELAAPPPRPAGVNERVGRNPGATAALLVGGVGALGLAGRLQWRNRRRRRPSAASPPSTPPVTAVGAAAGAVVRPVPPRTTYPARDQSRSGSWAGDHWAAKDLVLLQKMAEAGCLPILAPAAIAGGRWSPHPVRLAPGRALLVEAAPGLQVEAPEAGIHLLGGR